MKFFFDKKIILRVCIAVRGKVWYKLSVRGEGGAGSIEKSMKKGIVFAIEEFSVYDGPGIRTTVFLKGCPLRCNWCHNPEGLEQTVQIVRNPNGCIRCGKCYAKAAEHGGELTEECLNICPRNLIRRSGEYYSAEALAARLLKNADVFRATGGGVTFSGGECLLQADFLFETVGLLHGNVPVAIQTSGYGDSETFAKLLQRLDLVMFDLKLTDAEQFRRYTRGDVAVVLRNFDILAKSGVPYIPRTPLIPGVTDTPENLTAIAELLQQYGAKYIELLTYNQMAGSKYALVGKKYEPEFDETREPTADVTPFLERKIQTKVM